VLAHPERLSLRAAIDAACTSPGTVRTLFQPIVDIAHAVTTGYEALTRVELEPRLGPDGWLAAAYAQGRGTALEAAFLRSALGHREALPANCFLTVNVGPAALLSPEVQRVLASAGDLRGLVVELTEQDPVDDYTVLNAALAPLRAAGVMLAVDDAGAGFASLEHIAQLRPEIVKIDRGHVEGIDRDLAKEAAVRALGDFASRLDAWVVAEGVETAAELDALAALGVPLAQGYFLGRPSPAMAGATDEALAAHRAREVRHQAGGLGPLLSAATCVSDTEPPRVLAEAFLADPSLQHVVLVDAHRRPVGLAHRGDRDGGEILCDGLDAELRVLAERVVTRPAVTRFDPVAICDERGAIAGLLPVERLILELAR
jgi:EAL domain-containing protein (putative c-di-GMP-specific phosphodiesterase class I)